jgi:hypothetical protein
LDAGKFDAAINKMAAKSATAAPAPAPEAAPAPSGPVAAAVSDSDSQLPVLQVQTVEEFEESAAGMAGDAVLVMQRIEDNTSNSRDMDRGINKYSPSEGMGDPDTDNPLKSGPRGPGIIRGDEDDKDDEDE